MRQICLYNQVFHLDIIFLRNLYLGKWEEYEDEVKEQEFKPTKAEENIV